MFLNISQTTVLESLVGRVTGIQPVDLIKRLRHKFLPIISEVSRNIFYFGKTPFLLDTFVIETCL